MTKILLITLMIFFAAGCKNKNNIKSEVLPQSKMQSLIWDMMRADQFLADYVVNKDTSLSKATESLKYYQQIFAIHKVSKEDFEQSFSYYKSHPALLKEIMDSINSSSRNDIAVPLQSESHTDTVISKPDTLRQKPGKILQDTTKPRKKNMPLVVD